MLIARQLRGLGLMAGKAGGMPAPDNSPLPTSPALDPLDAFEPVAVPRWRLRVMGILCAGLASYAILPIASGGESVLSRALRGVNESLVETVFCLAPALSALLGAATVLRLSHALAIQAVPRWTSALSSVLCSLSLMWIGGGAYLVLARGPPGSGVLGWLCLACMLVGPLPALIALVLARVGPARAILASLSSSTLVLSLVCFILLVTRMRRPWAGTLVLLVLASIATITLGISCFLVYRRQRKLEEQFHAAMQERERERQMGRGVSG